MINLIRERLLLCLVSMLKEFLNNVIYKNITHQLSCVGKYFSKDLLFLVAVRLLQFHLNKS